MGQTLKRNRTTFQRCPKDGQHPFFRLPATLLKLDGYQLAIMVQILSNNDEWNLVQAEIRDRLGFPREKFRSAWKSLIDLGYIQVRRIQGGYDYTVYEDINSTSTVYGNCEGFTYTTGTTCKGGILTTINNNNNNSIEVTTTAGSTCQESRFDELLKLYPDEGRTKDGTTYPLKSNLDECRKAYIECLNSGEMTHDEIITALRVELNDKKMRGRSQYQKGLFKWLNLREFKQYKGMRIEPVDLGYGLNLE